MSLSSILFSALNSHFTLSNASSTALKLQWKPIIALSLLSSSPYCRYKTSKIDVNEFLANAAAVNDLRNSPLKLCLRYQKPLSQHYLYARCHHSHIADILLSEIAYVFARRRLMLRWSQAFCLTESGILIAAGDMSICSSVEKTRANTGVSSASIFATALWCGFTSSFEVGLGSFVPVACLRRMANAL